MTTVITYGTYDLLHHGHMNLLRNAKALGDYLIVGVTSDDFDRQRGKINVQQTLEERVAAVRATGLADKIVVEEYEGQKIDDIRKYGVDIFTVGSDWVGYFDYLNEYCKVTYLPRTKGISSTEIREKGAGLRFGMVGYSPYLNRVFRECSYVNGVKVASLCTEVTDQLEEDLLSVDFVTDDYEEFLKTVDAVYIHSHPDCHYDQVRRALELGKHVMCESPLAGSSAQCEKLIALAEEKNLVLMDSLRTAYSIAYERMLLLVKSGRIGEVVSVDATCTSLKSSDTSGDDAGLRWSSMAAWGPTALLPVFQVLGTDYDGLRITSRSDGHNAATDLFSEINIEYPHAVACIKVGSGVKSEGDLVISGTKGYVYVPAPWWKTEYFEIRYENASNNRRYFYQLDGEGIRFEWVAFLKMINEKVVDAEGTMDKDGDIISYVEGINRQISLGICEVVDRFKNGTGVRYI